MVKKATFSTFSKSATIGILATLVDLFLLYLLINIFYFSAVQANVPALALGFLIQFIGNKYFAFQNEDPRWLKQSALFIIVEIGAFFINAGFFHLLVQNTTFNPFIVRLTVGFLVYIGFSYPFWKGIFKTTPKPTA